jgi:transcriptional regulator with XRE-family HTH domain
MQPAAVGDQIKQWRSKRSTSQLALAYEVGVSPRHLSFVETGKSNPSAALVLALAEHLDVPLRERNVMLLAAGFAPRYHETSLDDLSMNHIASSLQRLLDAHNPYPGMILDRHHNVVRTNSTAALLLDTLPAHVAGPPINMFVASLHPDGFAGRSANAASWVPRMLMQLRRLVANTADLALASIENEVLAYPNMIELCSHRRSTAALDDCGVLWSSAIEIDGEQLSLFSTLTTFGSPLDITCEDIMLELFFPSDSSSEQALHRFADRAHGSVAFVDPSRRGTEPQQQSA